ncbi:hypothetical protein EK21DRAFT_61098, partial [Setomelanomma holmii]
DELNTWFWHEAEYNQEINCDFLTDGTDNYNEIGTALSALGLSSKPKSAGGDNMCYSIEHFDENAKDKDSDFQDDINQVYWVDGHDYSAHHPFTHPKPHADSRQATGAYCRFAINHHGGAIFPQNLESPKVAARKNWDFEPDDDTMPRLRLASDIMFAYWLHNNPNPKDLRYYFVNTVTNEATLRLMAKVVRKKGLQDLPPWSGVQLGMWEAEAEYMLGSSPIGATLAYLLIQHKAELGLKQVTSVNIFHGNWEHEDREDRPQPEIHVLFQIEDYVPPERTDADDDAVYARSIRVRGDAKNIVRQHVFRLIDGKVRANL